MTRHSGEYTGHVKPGGAAASHELSHLIVTKVSVGPMDNNAYLLRCRRTDEQVLIDAANDAPGPAPADRRRRPGQGRHHAPAPGPLAGAGRGDQGDRRDPP